MAEPETSALQWHPLTLERWADLEALFGPKGACAGCWCMWFRESRAEWERNKGEGNRLAMRALVESGVVPGLLAYRAATPVGWVSVGPRAGYPTLENGKVLARVDDAPVWSLVCFFVDKRYRKQGVTEFLLRAAIDHARARGASVLEAYPYDPKADKVSSMSAFMGMASTFRRLGFVEVARRSETRPIMRYGL